MKAHPAAPRSVLAAAIAAAITLLALTSCAHPRSSTHPAGAPNHPPERPDQSLQSKLQSLAARVHGDVGIYVHHLKSGRSAAIRADELFPTASMIKVPILLGTFDAINKGRLIFQQMVTYRDSLRYQYDDSLSMPRDGAQIPISRLTLQMITESNNTSSLWLQGLVGGDRINAWLQSHGFDSTRVNSRVAGRDGDRTKFGWGQTTPREMAGLVVMIREGRAISQAASEEMYRHLTRIYWNGEALSQLPPWVQAASKQGAVDKARSEVVLVNAPSGDYVFCVMTKNQTDESYAETNEGYELLRAVSALLWKEFEPGHPYTPAPDARKLKPPSEN